jgi:hypothetical protein
MLGRRGRLHDDWRPTVSLGTMAADDEQPHPGIDPTRVRRLREDAQRPMSTNLAEGIALSHLLARFVGVASRA